MKTNFKDYIPTDDEIDEIENVRENKTWGRSSQEAAYIPEEEIKILANQEDYHGLYNEEGENMIFNDEPVKKATKDLNLMNEGKMTNLEKDELRSRINASRPAEKKLTLRCFTTDELYSEIGRRLKKNDNYLKDMKTLIERYYDEDADLEDLGD